MHLRLLASGLLLVFAASLLPADAAAYSPSDAFAFLAAAGAIENADSGNAGDIITRGDVLKILLDGREDTRTRVHWHRGHLSRLPLFLDVSRDDAIAPYAEAAFALRITSGFSDRTLRPSVPIPAEEAITLLMRAYHQEGESAPGDVVWYAPFVRAALRRNLVDDPRSLRVGESVTRGRFVDMAYRMGVLARDNLVAFPAVADREGTLREIVGPTAGATALGSQIRESGTVLVARPTGDQGTLEQFRSARDFAITIPSLGIRDLPIAHPDDPQSKEGLLAPLRDGVGHLFSYPGRGGKIMIYGHSSGYAWDVSQYTKIFRQVNKLKKGDRVFVTFNGSLYEYAVTGQQTIAPKDAEPFTGDGEELILYTCWPPNSIKKRLIVRAVPVETVAVR